MTARHPKFQVQADGWGSGHDKWLLFFKQSPNRYTQYLYMQSVFTIVCAWFIIGVKNPGSAILQYSDKLMEVEQCVNI